MYIRWFLKRFHLVILEPSWFPRKKRILLWKAKIKCYLWASFYSFSAYFHNSTSASFSHANCTNCHIAHTKTHTQRHKRSRYRVIVKKVSFGIFSIILVSEKGKSFTIKSKGKKLSLGKFSWYLAIVKIIKIRHLECHINQENHDLKIIFEQK